MIRYVVVSDLIINGGKRCTILEKKPYMDYITIEVKDYIASHTRYIMITYDNNEDHFAKCLVFREMKVDRFINHRKSTVFINDLNNACMQLFRYKMCNECKHFQQDWRTVLCNRCCGYDGDNLAEKSDDYEIEVNRVSITDKARIIFTNVGKEICRSLPNESFNDFMTRIDISSLSHEIS